MRGELKWFEEDIPDDLTKAQEQKLIKLQLDSGAVEAAIVTRNGNKFLRYAIKTLS